MLYFEHLPPESPAQVHLTETGSRELSGSFEDCKRLGAVAASTVHGIMEMHGQEVAGNLGGVKAFTMAALTHAAEEAVAHQGPAVDIGASQDLDRSDGPTRVSSFLEGAGEFIAHGMRFEDADKDIKVR